MLPVAKEGQVKTKSTAGQSICKFDSRAGENFVRDSLKYDKTLRDDS